MASIEPDGRALEKQARGVKDRLLRADPSEGMIFELASVRCILDQLLNATEQLELRQKSMEIALAARDVIAACDPLEAFRLPNTAAIEADQLMNPADGFYNLEHDASGRPFRWTGPDRSFKFVIYVDRSEPRLISALFLSSVVPEVFAALQCFADDMLAPARYELEDNRHMIYAVLPARTFQDMSRTIITFVLPETARPSDVNSGSGDSRMLGVAFAKLEIGHGSIESVGRPEETGVVALAPVPPAVAVLPETPARPAESPKLTPIVRRRGVAKRGR